MGAGRKQAYPPEARAAFLKAHFQEGIPYTRAAQMLRDGELDCRAYPVSTSTCRSWRDKHNRDIAATIEPDEAFYARIVNQHLKNLAREQEKWSRLVGKPGIADPKSFREHQATIREAQHLTPRSTPKPDAEPTEQQEGLIDRLSQERTDPKPEAGTVHRPAGSEGSDAAEVESSPVLVPAAASTSGQQ